VVWYRKYQKTNESEHWWFGIESIEKQMKVNIGGLVSKVSKNVAWLIERI
jgi:hypothetical protein